VSAGGGRLEGPTGGSGGRRALVGNGKGLGGRRHSSRRLTRWVDPREEGTQGKSAREGGAAPRSRGEAPGASEWGCGEVLPPRGDPRQRWAARLARARAEILRELRLESELLQEVGGVDAERLRDSGERRERGRPLSAFEHRHVGDAELGAAPNSFAMR
jgi:hypothetical protein